MPHQEYLQVINYNISFTPAVINVVNLFDIPMPQCGPKQICNIHKVSTVFDGSALNVRWTIFLSLEPRDRFIRNNVHTQVMNDVFYQRIVFTQTGSFESPTVQTENYPYPFAYPYEKLRCGVVSSSIATGITWNVLVFYTIEPIEAKQLTAITIRRGTVAAIRTPGGPSA